MKTTFFLLSLLAVCFCLTSANIHTLDVTEDDRASIPVTSFGLIDRGVINITLTNFRFENEINAQSSLMGFRIVLTTTNSAATDDTFATESTGCPLSISETIAKNTIRLLLTNSSDFISILRGEEARVAAVFTALDGERLGNIGATEDNVISLPVGTRSISLIATPETEAMYHVYFYNCHNMAPIGDTSSSVVTFSTHIEQFNIQEYNTRDYLSAGESALPTILISLSCAFLVASFVWLGYMISHKANIFKIHYLMLALVFLKACSTFSLAMRYHTLKYQGKPDETWQIFYYIFRFIRTGLFFVAIAILAAGFTYIKSYLSSREKKVLILILVLQILSNSANVVYDEEEEGDKMYIQWKQINKLVNIISCGIVLVMTMWSINHLRDASGTSGKAARALSKLKLFKSFYVTLFFYVFYSEFFIDLLKASLPYKNEWVGRFMEDVGMLAFFIFIGYKFRPGSDNPYLQVPQDDEDDEEIPMDEVIGNTGANVGATLVSRGSHSETA